MPPLRQVLDQASGKKELVYSSKDEARADIDKLAGEMAPDLPTIDQLKAS